MSTCKHCGRQVPDTHYCTIVQRTITRTGNNDADAGDFLLSAAIAAATDSTLLGTVLGGSFTGGLAGDLLDGDIFD